MEQATRSANRSQNIRPFANGFRLYGEGHARVTAKRRTPASFASHVVIRVDLGDGEHIETRTDRDEWAQAIARTVPQSHVLRAAGRAQV